MPEYRDVVAAETMKLKEEILAEPINWAPPRLYPFATRETLRKLRGDRLYDVFVCHASDDKDRFVRSLVARLQLE